MSLRQAGSISFGLPMKTILAEASRVPFGKQIEDIVMSTPIADIHTHLLENKYPALAQTGWQVKREEIQRDLSDLFGDGLERFCGRS